jgi:hypothetical protein
MRRFFHQRVGKGVQSFQKCRTFRRVKGRECRLERTAPVPKPLTYRLGGFVVQRDDGPAPVLRVFTTLHEPVVLEVAGQLAGGRQREADRLGELRDGLRLLGPEVGEQSDVAPSEPRVPLDELQQLWRRPPPSAHGSHDPAQGMLQLMEVFGYHEITIIV